MLRLRKQQDVISHKSAIGVPIYHLPFYSVAKKHKSRGFFCEIICGIRLFFISLQIIFTISKNTSFCLPKHTIMKILAINPGMISTKVGVSGVA